MKAKIGDLQKQLEQDDRLELIDRAVNAEVRLSNWSCLSSLTTTW